MQAKDYNNVQNQRNSTRRGGVGGRIALQNFHILIPGTCHLHGKAGGSRWNKGCKSTDLKTIFENLGGLNVVIRVLKCRNRRQVRQRREVSVDLAHCC